MKLSERTYRCSCGYVAYRDYNSAINIKNEGIRLLALAQKQKLLEQEGQLGQFSLASKSNDKSRSPHFNQTARSISGGQFTKYIAFKKLNKFFRVKKIGFFHVEICLAYVLRFLLVGPLKLRFFFFSLNHSIYYLEKQKTLYISTLTFIRNIFIRFETFICFKTNKNVLK